MKRSAMLLAATIILVAGTVLAGPPLNGAYQSTDLGGSVYVGRYTEAWDAGGGALDTGTTLNATSWDGMTLGTQWQYYCGTEVAAPIVLIDNVDVNGNGNRTYQKYFMGGYIWLSGTGPWANGDPDYPGYISSYFEFETVTYSNFVPIAAITNVQASAHFDNYPELCMAFYIGNGSRVADTNLGDPVPADYPGLLDANCDATRTEGAFWDFFTITLSITSCTVGTEETTWGAVKDMYHE
jgi:hypothetical protein